MNITKCTNSHFYDADKYSVCPHCGAESIESKVSAVAPQTQKKESGFWNRKRTKSKEKSVVEMPDRTIGRTFAIFSDDAESTAAFDTKATENTPADNHPFASPAEIPTEETANDHSSAFCAPCPEEEPAKEAVYNTVDEEKNTHKSLLDEVKKVSASAEGKTVGFFSAGRPTDAPEPVVGWVVCIKGPHFGESFNISSGRNSVGRNKTNKIVFHKDDSVSREKHAWIIYEPKKREFFIQPGDSSGLTYLNGDTILESKKLQTNDVLEFGRGQYLFVPLCGDRFAWDDITDRE